MSVVITLIGIIFMSAGYFFYSRFIAEKIYRLDPDFKTPAHEFNDGIDYIPTNKMVLWGHHFTSVAGGAPIIGPAIAIIWGWLPALLWVVLGTIFFAGIHDMGSIWVSVRNRGQSIGTSAGSLINKRARNLCMVVMFLVALMVNGAFAVAISGSFIKTPTSIVPSWGAILTAVVIGQMIYKLKMNLVFVSVLGVIVLYALLYLGTFIPLSLPENFLGLPPQGQWILILYGYCMIASMLPVWVLLQPRDYINGIQLFIGLIILYISVFLFSGEMTAPVVNTDVPEGTPPLMPLLFVTIACGAVSGFHSLVSSGTTSKQINRETDIRFVGYGGALGEGLLALAAILAVGSGFLTRTEWGEVYASFGSGGLNGFIQGGANIIHLGLGLPRNFSVNLLAVMAILFAGTTMDTGLRLQRYIVQEWGVMYKIKPLQNGFVATVIAAAVCIALAFGTGDTQGKGGLLIWPLFGTSNQIMAGLSLLVISVMLYRNKRVVFYTLIPMIFLLAMTVFSLIYQLAGFYQKGLWLLVVMDLVVLISAVWVVLEALKVFMDLRRQADLAEIA